LTRKIVFFDIDGTIWNVHNEIPESTAEAIKRLRENGNLVFINTGRTRGYLRRPNLFALGFDGIISGAGTMIEYCSDSICSGNGDIAGRSLDTVVDREINDSNVIYYHRIEPELAEYTVITARQYGFRPILEGKHHLYLEDKEFAADPFGHKVITEMEEDRRNIDDCWGKWEMSKLSCATDSPDREKGLKILEKDYHLQIHNENVCEFVPNGYGKDVGGTEALLASRYRDIRYICIWRQCK
jgi:hydroxymethylpyrimidine pyrophosphatase-like HAD family hydrolase